MSLLLLISVHTKKLVNRMTQREIISNFMHPGSYLSRSLGQKVQCSDEKTIVQKTAFDNTGRTNTSPESNSLL